MFSASPAIFIRTKIKPFLAIFLFLLFLPLSGCSGSKNTSPFTDQDNTPALPSFSAPSVTESKDTTFASFLDTVFRDYASFDSLSLHYTLLHPEAYQIETTPVTLGHFSKEELLLSGETAKNHLAMLHTFSREALEPSEQFLYDLLEYALEGSILPEGTVLYDSPLSPTTGLQTQLPVLLAEYRFETLSDVENYFLLLADLPRYFEDIAAFERERAAAGVQFCAEVLSRILLQCEAFIENPGKNFLIEGFYDRLSSISALDATTKAELCITNQNLVFTKVIPAYETLMEALTSLTDTSVPARGLCALPDGCSYYEYLVRSTTGSDRSIAELETMLETALLQNMLTMITLYESDTLQKELSAFQTNGLSVRSGISTPNVVLSQENEALLPASFLELLREEMQSDFPEPSAVSYRVQTVPPSLEDFISPALYLVPPLDAYESNVIYINQKKCSTASLFSTLAHEGYPGHLYQNTYFAATSPHPIRMLLNFTGYDEGWGTYAELFSYQYADCSETLRQFLVAEQVAALCVYSLSDIRIHYHGNSLEDIAAFLQNYGLSADAAKELYYIQLAEPAAYLPYSIGYLELCSLKEEYFSMAGDTASLLSFHTFLLETGPAPFSLLKTHLKKNF